MAPADRLAADGRPGPEVVSGMLLTGGRSRRMGRHKATVVVGGERLADRTAALLSAVADPVIEVGPGYTSLPCTCEDPPGAGPLAAVAAGAAWLGPRSPSLVIATDLPKLTAGMLRLLADHPAGGCVVPLDTGGRPQFGCARYSVDALTLAPGLLVAGHRSLRALLDRAQVTWIPQPGWIGVAGGIDVLADVDTPEDLAAL